MAQVAPPRTFLTIAEVAEELRVSRSTIKRKIAAGELPALKLGSGEKTPVRIDRAELDAWLYGFPPQPHEPGGPASQLPPDRPEGAE